MNNIIYPITQSGSYTATVSDGSSESSQSNAAVFKKWLKINNQYVSKINSAYINIFNSELVNSGRENQLLRPANVSVTSNILTFDPSQGATGYDIYADGNKVGEV